MLLNVLLIVVCAIAALIVGRALGKWAFSTKQDLTKVRRAAQSLAISLREAGLRRMPEMLEAFTVGGLPDLLDGVQDLAKLLKSGNATILQELQGTFDHVLGVKLNSPEGRAVIEAKLVEAKAHAIEVAKVVGPIAAKAALVAVL